MLLRCSGSFCDSNGSGVRCVLLTLAIVSQCCYVLGSIDALRKLRSRESAEDNVNTNNVLYNNNKYNLYQNSKNNHQSKWTMLQRQGVDKNINTKYPARSWKNKEMANVGVINTHKIDSNSLSGSSEPSCDELRAMWRLSKRAGYQTLITNDIPTVPDPFGYAASLPEYAGEKAAYAFGRIISSSDQSNNMAKISPFRQVQHHLRDGIFSDGANGRNNKVSLSKPLPYNKQYPSRSHLRMFQSQETMQPRQQNEDNERRFDSSFRLSYPLGSDSNDDGEKKSAAVLDDRNEPSQIPVYLTSDRLQVMPGKFSTDTVSKSGCESIGTKHCQSASDCSCYGFYSCVHGRCHSRTYLQPSPSNTRIHTGGQFHRDPLVESDIGVLKTHAPENHHRFSGTDNSQSKSLRKYKDEIMAIDRALARL